LEKKERNLIAIDETVVKARKKKYYVYSAVDVERNELILVRVYTTRNYLTAKSFVKEALNSNSIFVLITLKSSKGIL